MEEEDASQNGLSTEESFTADEKRALPLFTVEVPEAVKRGENVMFTIHANDSTSERGRVVLRQHEDLEWLHHNLVVGNKTDGAIIPPLPQKPVGDPKSAESLSKRQLGDSSKVMKGDQFEVNCKAVQTYLQMLLGHSVFGRDTTLSKFLTEDDAPVRTKLNKGLMNKLSSVIEMARKSNHKDVDEYFTQQRNFAIDFSKAIKDINALYTKVLLTQWRLSSTYRQIASDISLCKDETDIEFNQILKLLGEGMEYEAASLELQAGKGEVIVGSHLDLFSRISDSLKDMHLRRTIALIDYETSEKMLEKAKPLKRPLAEEVFENNKKAFEECTQRAKEELKLFHEFRVQSSADVLTKFAELQMKISQDFYSQLSLTRSELADLNI